MSEGVNLNIMSKSNILIQLRKQVSTRNYIYQHVKYHNVNCIT